MKLALYSYWRSSCSYRVRIALALKEINYDYKTIDILIRSKTGKDEGEFNIKNPMGQVPVLEVMDDNKKHYLMQSLPIIEFLEESFPGTYSLLPNDKILRQKTRAMAEVINSGIQPLQNLETLNEIEKLGGNKAEWSRNVINKGLKALETMVKETSGRFCIGDDITLVDIFLVPQIYNAKRFGVEVEKYPLLFKIYQRCSDLEAFDKSSPEKQPDCPDAKN